MDPGRQTGHTKRYGERELLKKVPEPRRRAGWPSASSKLKKRGIGTQDPVINIGPPYRLFCEAHAEFSRTTVTALSVPLPNSDGLPQWC